MITTYLINSYLTYDLFMADYHKYIKPSESDIKKLSNACLNCLRKQFFSILLSSLKFTEFSRATRVNFPKVTQFLVLALLLASFGVSVDFLEFLPICRRFPQSECHARLAATAALKVFYSVRSISAEDNRTGALGAVVPFGSFSFPFFCLRERNVVSVSVFLKCK